MEMVYMPIQHTLTSTQEVLLSHGPHFAVAARNPYQDYITAIEVACQSLKTTEAEEVRADI